MCKSEPIKVKNPLALSLPDITVTLEMSGTVYHFKGVYDGERALSSKLIHLMGNENISTKGADK